MKNKLMLVLLKPVLQALYEEILYPEALKFVKKSKNKVDDKFLEKLDELVDELLSGLK